MSDGSTSNYQHLTHSGVSVLTEFYGKYAKLRKCLPNEGTSQHLIWYLLLSKLYLIDRYVINKAVHNIYVYIIYYIIVCIMYPTCPMCIIIYIIYNYIYGNPGQSGGMRKCVTNIATTDWPHLVAS